MFIQDYFNPADLRIYIGGEVRPASYEECEGLERCALWDAEHIEDRLRSYYDGVPDKWSEPLRRPPAG